MTSGFSQNSSRFSPDFFNQISSGNFGSNIGNNSSYSPLSFGGSDPRNPGFRTNLGSLYGMAPTFQSSMGLQPDSSYGTDLSFYGSTGQSASPGSFGLGTGYGGLYFSAPTNANESPSFSTLGNAQNTSYGGMENTLGSSFSYTPQYDDLTTNLYGTNARGGAAAGLIEDNSGTSYGNTNYNQNSPSEYNYRQSNYTPYGDGLSTGSGNVSASIASPNANGILLNNQFSSQQGGYAKQNINQGQASNGSLGASMEIVPAPGISGLLGNDGVNIRDIAGVGAKATNQATNEAQLLMPGNINSSLNATSGVNAQNISPIFGNPVNAGVDLATSSDINLNTGLGGFAQGTATSNTEGKAASGINQDTTITQSPLTGKPKYYTYTTPEGTLDITSDQSIAAQAASFTPINTSDPAYKKWVSSSIPISVKEDFNKMQQAMPGVFGNFPDFDTFAAYQYAKLNPNAQAQINQSTSGKVYNDLGSISTNGNQYANIAAGDNGNITADLYGQSTGNALSTPGNTGLNTGTNLQSSIGASGDTFGVFSNQASSAGTNSNRNPYAKTDANMQSSSNASTNGLINTSSRVSSLSGPQNTGGMGGQVFGVAPILPGQKQGPTPVVIPPKPANNIIVNSTNSNLNSVFSPFNNLF